MWLEEKCTRCKRIVNRRLEGYEGEKWEIMELFDTFKRVCWVCKCKEDEGKKHTDVVIDIINYGCGC